MDERLMKKMEQKLNEIVSNKHELQSFIGSLTNEIDPQSFLYGIVVGRLYNAFYYQSKRILQRSPTGLEFQEFLNFLKSKKSIIANLWG